MLICLAVMTPTHPRQQAGGPLIEVGDEQARLFPCFEPATALEFWVQPESLWPPPAAAATDGKDYLRNFAPLFSVELSSYRSDGKLRMPRYAKGTNALQAPQFRVVPLPDATTVVSCAKSSLMVGEATTCYISPKSSGSAVLTLPRTSQCLPTALVDLP